MGQRGQICCMNDDISITSINDVRHDKYSKLKIVSVYQLGLIYHCETAEGDYLWVEPHDGVLVMCLTDMHHKMGDGTEVVSKYEGGKPSWEKIQIHMKWKINEEDIWVN